MPLTNPPDKIEATEFYYLFDSDQSVQFKGAEMKVTPVYQVAASTSWAPGNYTITVNDTTTVDNGDKIVAATTQNRVTLQSVTDIYSALVNDNTNLIVKDLHDKLKNILAKAVKTVGGNLNNIPAIRLLV